MNSKAEDRDRRNMERTIGKIERITGLGASMSFDERTTEWAISAVRDSGRCVASRHGRPSWAVALFLAENLSAIREELLLSANGGRCAKCGDLFNLELDHIVPRSHGRDDRKGNCQMLCRPCHRAKTGELQPT